MDQLTIPDGFRPLETQVAGHTFQTETATLGMLESTQSGCVFKPMGKPECGEREHNFYKQIQNAKDEVCSRARAFIPRFYNLVNVCVNERQRVFLKLENVAHGLQKPCIIDIKVGRRTWDPLATAEKRAVEEKKYARCKNTLGLCLPGMQVYKMSGSEPPIRHGRDYGKQLDHDGFRHAIRYFLNAEQNVCEILVREILSQLYAIRSWFNVQTMFRFYASSLLIAYDFDAWRAHLRRADRTSNGNGDIVQSSNGLPPESEHNASESNSPSSCPTPQYSKQWVKVKMIDFAHVFPNVNNELDINYMFGLLNLISILEDLLDK